MRMLTHSGFVNCKHGIDLRYLNSRYLKQTKVDELYLFTETVCSSFNTLDLERRVTKGVAQLKQSFSFAQHDIDMTPLVMMRTMPLLLKKQLK